LSSVEFDVKKLNDDINEVAYADYIIFAIPSAFVGAELEN
jgi:glycerol-3-phosphate dehydrogenase (NAD(P)+)